MKPSFRMEYVRNATPLGITTHHIARVVGRRWMERLRTMADKLYCINAACPFKDCERHLSKVPKPAIGDKGYVRVADLDGVCARYNSYLVDEINNERK